MFNKPEPPPPQPKFVAYTDIGIIGAAISLLLLTGNLLKYPLTRGLALRFIGLFLTVIVCMLLFITLQKKVSTAVAVAATSATAFLSFVLIGALS